MKNIEYSPSEASWLGQETLNRNERPAWLPPKLTCLNIDETQGALAGNADPFFS